ncbi:ATPase [Chryseobacterium sp. IHB B 17019]|uniref:SRPBCC family protein n=1 Tax=Chryseobacterium sp. IHB B 17019 TaxID=1721091 RepID=UPI00071FF73A|nr:SRPBCC domain-containing protein [Chryseobacterium sp. IHB B 17019]ALR30383.1 ATPase [Chryseobacterium sp. IHB B 17019]
MELKTKIHAEDGKQEILITREFDLPLDLLFRAYTEPEIVEQWMGTKVLKMENKQHGSYQFETSNPQGDVVFRANGAIHEFVPNEKITRTFQMENTPFPVQIEFLEFEKLSDETSKITIQAIYKSVDFRDQHLRLPFAQGINMAHNRLEETVKKLEARS